MTILFGQFTAKFTNFSTGGGSAEEFRNNVDNFVLWFVYLFVGRFVLVYVANTTVSIAAIRTTRAIRRAFLESTLRQEVWHFDKDGNGSPATQVTTSKLPSPSLSRSSGCSSKLTMLMFRRESH